VKWKRQLGWRASQPLTLEYLCVAQLSASMQFKVGPHVSIEMLQKAQEFRMSMARLALRDDPALDDVERREEGGRAVVLTRCKSMNRALS
jgi:hypothetical protein